MNKFYAFLSTLQISKNKLHLIALDLLRFQNVSLEKMYENDNPTIPVRPDHNPVSSSSISLVSSWFQTGQIEVALWIEAET